MFISKGLLTGLLLGSLSLGANALVMQTLEQSPLDGGDGNSSSGSFGTQVADNFQFANDVTLNNISWWGSYYPDVPATEEFTVRVFTDNGAGFPQPSALFTTNFAANGDDSDGLGDYYGAEVFRYDVAVAWALSGGQNYYLSVFNNDDTNDWFWLESAAGGNIGWSRVADGDIWDEDNPAFNMSFRLTTEPVFTGSVPEPSPLFLFALFSLYLLRGRVRGGTFG